MWTPLPPIQALYYWISQHTEQVEGSSKQGQVNKERLTMLLILGRSGTQYVAMVTRRLSSYC